MADGEEEPMNTDSQTHKDEKTAKSEAKRTRITRIYPAWTFEQSLPLAEAIQKHASGERADCLTLLKAVNKNHEWQVQLRI